MAETIQRGWRKRSNHGQARRVCQGRGSAVRQALWPWLLRRKESWVLTWRGWLAAFVLAGLIFLALLLSVHPFLAVSDRVAPDVLVIDGWIPEYSLLDGWREFQVGHYTTLLTVGGPFRNGLNLDPDDDYGDLAAYSLRKILGKDIPVHPVKCPLERRDRTYTSAIMHEGVAGEESSIRRRPSPIVTSLAARAAAAVCFTKSRVRRSQLALFR